MSRFIISR